MATITASGSSSLPDSAAAAKECASRAAASLPGGKASFGFLFAGPKHELGGALRAASEASGGAEIIGCTTAGEFTETGLTHNAMSILLVSAEGMSIQGGAAVGISERYVDAARTLCHDFPQTLGAARQKGLAHSITVTLVDGLAGTGEKLVQEIVSSTQPLQQVVGGAAGDEGAFKATWVGRNGEAMKNAATALHIFGEKQWGVGVGHGLEATTEPMRVTSSKGNVLFELDGKPAFDAYKAHAKKRGIELTTANASEYMIQNELGIFRRDKIAKARAPLSANADGSLVLAADIPFGASVAILDGKPAMMIAAARGAAEEAKRHLDGVPPAGVLVFDCICRGLIMKEQLSEEIGAIRAVLGNVPVAGFLTYGEIANYKGKLDHWHNTTAVVVAIPA